MTRSARSSLREHKKALTRNALADAAFDIVREEGAHMLTAEAVAARAGVSRRTFFNYFASLDLAVAHSVQVLLDQLTEHLSARPADESVWDTIEVMLFAPEGTAILERIAVLGAAGEHFAPARHLAHDHVEVFVEWLAGWLATRLEPGVDELYAASLAASVAAVAEAAQRVWVRRTGGDMTPRSLTVHRELLTHALLLLRSGFDSPDTGPSLTAAQPAPALTAAQSAPEPVTHR